MQVNGNDNLNFTKQNHNNYLRNTNKQQRALKSGKDIRLERTFNKPFIFLRYLIGM